MAAVSRGVHFEVCYAQALAADSRGRATFLGNLAELLRATRGRGIVLSSGARLPSGHNHLRAPADVVNLLAVWGLPPDRGLQGLGSLARAIVVNESIRRSGFRGVVDIVSVADEARDKAEVLKDADGDLDMALDEGTSSDAGKKRKHGQLVSAAEGDKPISKRQAKKLRAAMKKAKDAGNG
jgi:ribonuclease P/MRP protein subunit RPP1